MITRRVARLERFFLMPLVFLFPALAIYYLFHAAWLLAVLLLVASFCVGLVGQSLHKDKSYDELKQGGLTAETNVLPSTKELSSEESRTLARPMLFGSWLCAITLGALLVHHGYSGWTSLEIAVCTGVLLPVLLALLVVRA
jgi:hypothetical protein